MKREYHTWWSPRLEREMELLVFGHAGPRLLVFPTREQRFFEYENHGMIHSVRHALEAGKLQMLCVDGIDSESLYGFNRAPADRLERHLQYERYVVEEVLPFFEKLNPGTPLTAHGCSLGAFHAMALALRHPQHFQGVLAFSGRYDLTLHVGDFFSLFHGYECAAVEALMPSRFLPALRSTKQLRALRQLKVHMVIGEEDPFCSDNAGLAQAMRKKKIPCELHFWCGNSHRFRYWRQMIRVYLGLTPAEERGLLSHSGSSSHSAL